MLAGPIRHARLEPPRWQRELSEEIRQVPPNLRCRLTELHCYRRPHFMVRLIGMRVSGLRYHITARGRSRIKSGTDLPQTIRVSMSWRTVSIRTDSTPVTVRDVVAPLVAMSSMRMSVGDNAVKA